jgi:hypothetical protein
MNHRYGYMPLPPGQPCVMCNVPCDIVRQFPCGCHLPIHGPCVYTFMRQGGVCVKCHQVWVQIDTATVTTAWDASSRQDILVRRPAVTQVSCCESSRLTYFYAVCCIFLLLAAILLAYILYRVL